MFSRFADPNILPYLHTVLVFYRYLAYFPLAMRIQRKSEFPRPEGQLPRPLPEDFALRGLFWTCEQPNVGPYFPSDWFSNHTIEEDEKYDEFASMADERRERILWLSVSIAQHKKWLLYDENLHRFSVPSRFEEGVNISMGIDTDIANIAVSSRASTSTLCFASDDAIGQET